MDSPLASRPRRVRRLAALTALLAIGATAVPTRAAGEGAAWSVFRERPDPDGYELYRSTPAGSRFAAYRLVTRIAAPPARVVEAALQTLVVPDAAGRMDRRLVRRGENVLVSYTYIRVPLLADRYVTLRTEIDHDPDTGSWRLAWRDTDEEGPTPPEGVVRVEKSEGFWEFAPLGRGRTRVVYESHAEVGRSMPAWLVDSMQADSVVEHVSELRALLRSR